MRFDLRLNQANGLFGLLVAGFMLLSVACSHTRTASNQLDGLSEEVELSETRSTAADEKTSVANPTDDLTVPSSANEEAAVEIEAPPVSQASSATPDSSDDLVALAEADLKAVGESQETSSADAFSAPVTTVRARPLVSKSRKARAPKSDLAEFTDLVAKSIQMPPEEPVEEPKPQLASSDLSEVIERNLVWLVGLLMVGALWVFLVVRRNRKARFNSPF